MHAFKNILAIIIKMSLSSGGQVNKVNPEHDQGFGKKREHYRYVRKDFKIFTIHVAQLIVLSVFT